VDIGTGPFQHFKGGNVNTITRIAAHAGVAGTGDSVFMGLYHLLPFSDILLLTND
jgi:hypothetical protein